ncbi:hypothetical protein HGRIS_003088 [Hohenbuehelia grisea]|uniref:Fungal lipase-type domain-containing protein n=1 Tax=Hohenbuehelia grisea TaxID=104357 RepID=A0ABR3JMD9_9AGAR
MRAMILPTLFVWVLVGMVAAAPLREMAIPDGVYNELVRFAKYSSLAYMPLCPKPLGNVLIKKIDQQGTQGYLIRDDKRKEIVLTFRGTSEPADVVTDAQAWFTDLKTPGVPGAKGARVHTGFQDAYNYVVKQVHELVDKEVKAYPKYQIIVTGHSLGGAVASFGAISLKARYPKTPLKIYTYGSPRVGNQAFADYVEKTVGISNSFRSVHTTDGVPIMLPMAIGYRHFGVEYWNFQDPPSAQNTKQCKGGEDKTCSNQNWTIVGINIPHAVQHGIFMAVSPSFCF